jgi:hypothetical protein
LAVGNEIRASLGARRVDAAVSLLTGIIEHFRGIETIQRRRVRPPT